MTKKKKGAKAKGIRVKAGDETLSPYGKDGMPTMMMPASFKGMDKAPAEAKVSAKKRGAKKAAIGKKKAK